MPDLLRQSKHLIKNNRYFGKIVCSQPVNWALVKERVNLLLVFKCQISKNKNTGASTGKATSLYMVNLSFLMGLNEGNKYHIISGLMY